MDLTKKQKKFMRLDGHVLMTGGPGSGKITVAIFKAVKIVQEDLLPGQKVLFLSFARATISRVVEAIKYEQKIPSIIRAQIEVETYHAFFWRILKTHGYLIGLPRKISLLSPASEAIALSSIRNSYARGNKLSEELKKKKAREIASEQQRMAFEEGYICFDLFAHLVSELLSHSKKIRKLIANKYPVIIFDEFQDTDNAQWLNTKLLGKNSSVIALADPEQRIYDWLGADPERLDHFRAEFENTEVDLSTENHRSAGTDIALFANHILTRNFRPEPYVGISIIGYTSNNDAQAFTKLITTVYASRKRLIDARVKDWSVAVLVPNKHMTRQVSDCFMQPPVRMPPIFHRAVVDMEAITLSAEFIAFCLQAIDAEEQLPQYMKLICDFFEGKGGDAPTKASMQLAGNIRKQFTSFQEGKKLRKSSILIPMIEFYEELQKIELEGNPEKDWMLIRQHLENSQCPRLRKIAEEAKNVRLLDRGEQLRVALSEDWSANGRYKNSFGLVQKAFVQEHLSMGAKPEVGVIIMNMHKAKGKQFDEVIIFENRPNYFRGEIVANKGRLVRGNDVENINDQSLQNFRVSITRGKLKTTILTPSSNPSVLLP